MEKAGYEKDGDGYLNGLCKMFGITGTDANLLKKAIKLEVGKEGDHTPDTLVGAFFTVMNSGTNNFGKLEQMVYGSVYTNRTTAKGIIPAIQDTKGEINKLTEAAEDDFDDMADWVDKWEDAWVEEFDNATTYTEKLYKAYYDLVQYMDQARRYPDDVKRVVTKHVTEYEDDPYSYDYKDTGNTGGNLGDGIINNTEDDNWWHDEETYGLYGTSGVADNNKNWFVSTTDDPWILTGYDNVNKSLGGKDKYTFEKNGVERSIYLDSDEYFKLVDEGYFKEPSYDTGGYTGDWGTSAGRLAMIHEKELILNKSDTENMLGAIGILRDLVSKIEINSLSAMTASLQTPNKI
jgi:hypothetical protein